MPYVTTGERIGFERGQRTAYLATCKHLLKARFGDAGLELLSHLQGIEDIEKLKSLHQALAKGINLEGFQRLLR